MTRIWYQIHPELAPNEDDTNDSRMKRTFPKRNIIIPRYKDTDSMEDTKRAKNIFEDDDDDDDDENDVKIHYDDDGDTDDDDYVDDTDDHDEKVGCDHTRLVINQSYSKTYAQLSPKRQRLN